MSSYKIENLSLVPVCVGISGLDPVPPERVNPFSPARADNLQLVMHEELDFVTVGEIVGNEVLAAANEAEAMEAARARCSQIFTQNRKVQDGKTIILNGEAAAYRPIGGGRHENCFWALLAGSSDSGACEPWSFVLPGQERVYVFFRVRVAPIAPPA